MKKTLFPIFAVFAITVCVGQKTEADVGVLKKEFEETDSFIKKIVEKTDKTPTFVPETKEAKKEELPKPSEPANMLFLKSPPAVVIEFYNRQLARERNAWLLNIRTVFARHGGWWQASVVYVQGGIVVQYYFVRLSPPVHYNRGGIYVSDVELMAKWRNKLSSLAESSLPERMEKILPVRKGKKKPL